MKELATKFEALYRGLQRAHGTYIVTGNDEQRPVKVVGKAITVYEVPTVAFWQAHLEGRRGIGIVPINEGNQCRWGAIDIDQYHDGLIEEVEKKALDSKLPLIVLRTKSGGTHIACFLTEPIEARIVRSKMMEIAVAFGFPGVEIYPKQVVLASDRDCGNWLNMPYFEAERTNRYAVYRGKKLSAENFIKLATKLACTPEQFLALNTATEGAFCDGAPCLQTLSQLRVAIGGRNDAMFAMGVYARMKFPDTWEAILDGYNAEFFTPALPSKEVQMVAKSLARKETYFYPCTKPPLVGHCNKQLCMQRQYGIGQGGTEPDLAIGKLVKLCTEPPTWIIDVEGVRFELDTDELMSQNRFAKCCMEKINRWPPAVKPLVWQRLVQARLADVEIIDAPKEASLDGRVLWHLEQFCVVSAPARVREEMLLGKPWTDSGRHYFRSEDLSRYLNQHGIKEITPRKLWALLRHNAGAQHEQFQIKGRCTQAWSIKEFAKQTETFEPHILKEDF
jgi:hypothetical protein